MPMNLIIADTNKEYMKRLGDYISSKYQEEYTIELIDDKHQLKERVKMGKCEVVLLAPNLYDPGINLKNIDLPIILLDEEVPLTYPDKFKRAINKYTRITKLVKYIQEEYQEMEKNRPLVYGVYSPAGGVGKTTIALATAISYVKAGKKVLYINLEDLDSTPMYFDKSKNIKVDELSKVARDSYEQILVKKINKDKNTGVMYLGREDKTSDSYGVSGEKISQTIESVIETGMANVVVVDTSTEINFLNKKVFEISDYILMIVNQNTQAIYKTNTFMNKGEIIEPIKDKIKVVINQGKEAGINQDVEVIARIDKLYATNPLGLCEYIAENHFLNLHGLTVQ